MALQGDHWRKERLSYDFFREGLFLKICTIALLMQSAGISDTARHTSIFIMIFCCFICRWGSLRKTCTWLRGKLQSAFSIFLVFGLDMYKSIVYDAFYLHNPFCRFLKQNYGSLYVCVLRLFHMYWCLKILCHMICLFSYVSIIQMYVYRINHQTIADFDHHGCRHERWNNSIHISWGLSAYKEHCPRRWFINFPL